MVDHLEGMCLSRDAHGIDDAVAARDGPGA
jgi:hypothetical protein